jgi:hypothetical protein
VPDSPLDDPLWTPERIAAALELYELDGVTPDVAAVYELTRKRARDPLPVLKIGKRMRVRRSAFVEWLERRTRVDRGQTTPRLMSVRQK